jgi:hypothetical protein
MSKGWAVEIHVHDADRLTSTYRFAHPGPRWLKAVGSHAHPWTREQALAVARREASLQANYARNEPGPDISVMRDPEGDMDGDCYEVIEHRGSMEQSPEPILTLVVRQVPFATAKYGASEAIRAAYDEAAVAHFRSQ